MPASRFGALSVIPRWLPMLRSPSLWCTVCVLLTQSPARFPFRFKPGPRASPVRDVATRERCSSLDPPATISRSSRRHLECLLEARCAIIDPRRRSHARAYVHGINPISRRTAVHMTRHLSPSRMTRFPRRIRGVLAGSPEGSRIRACRFDLGRCDATREMLGSISREAERERERPLASRYLRFHKYPALISRSFSLLFPLPLFSTPLSRSGLICTVSVTLSRMRLPTFCRIF